MPGSCRGFSNGKPAARLPGRKTARDRFNHTLAQIDTVSSSHESLLKRFEKRITRRPPTQIIDSEYDQTALVSFVLFVLSLYVWQIPPVHNAALLNSLIHWAMHLTMLATGLLFFAMVFGRRDVPSAPSAHSATLRDDRNEHPSGCDHSLQDHRSLSCRSPTRPRVNSSSGYLQA
ncbi:MAG TPA: hypothetical protein ENH55_17445 [Aurantimonas coralicida]|uniref:Uncharacterized protein n=1 Tax=Aurantimonas coralicida TaxID=182270 RepID=A0A9C9TIW4_9HYPH|nr:hypothetical protein [Aurantimonas coralicida]HEU02970.1 hypothetical protein [Aurantimonas coralicida]